MSLLDWSGEAAKIRPFPLCQSLESFCVVEGKHIIAKAITRVPSSVDSLSVAVAQTGRECVCVILCTFSTRTE